VFNKRQSRPDVVIIGAGPSGLAVARELEHQHGISALVVEKAAAPAVSWRTRYDNFRLNTNGFLSHLPGQRIPLTAGRWPTKEDMVRYFDRYVRLQNIKLQLQCEVNHINRAPGGWLVDTSSGEIRTPAIVLATGRYHTPIVPPWPGLDHFSGELVHSGDFSNAWPFCGRDVLVVGAGNSAADIAVQLANCGARKVWLSVRTPPHLVRRAMGPIPSDLFLELFARVPAHIIDPPTARLNRLLFGDLSVYGFDRPPLGLKATVEQRGRIPTLADELVDAVAATGFSTDLDGLVGHLGVLDEHGSPRGGFASDLGDGMFAIGYGIPPNGPLRAIRLAATPLAGQVATYLATQRHKPLAGHCTKVEGNQWRYSPQSGSSTAV
jgi:cation diffusion facilitator CzcD-associated flavoprotein CzcO